MRIQQGNPTVKRTWYLNVCKNPWWSKNLLLYVSSPPVPGCSLEWDDYSDMLCNFFCSDVFHRESGAVELQALRYLKHKYSKGLLTEVQMKHKLPLSFLCSPAGAGKSSLTLTSTVGCFLLPQAGVISRLHCHWNGDIKWHKRLEELEKNLVPPNLVIYGFWGFSGQYLALNFNILDINRFP